jgi:hypothetical protein
MMMTIIITTIAACDQTSLLWTYSSIRILVSYRIVCIVPRGKAHAHGDDDDDDDDDEEEEEEEEDTTALTTGTGVEVVFVVFVLDEVCLGGKDSANDTAAVFEDGEEATILMLGSL